MKSTVLLWLIFLVFGVLFVLASTPIAAQEQEGIIVRQYPLLACEHCGYIEKGIVHMTLSARGAVTPVRIADPVALLRSLQSISARDVWINYDIGGGGYDMPEGTRLAGTIRFTLEQNWLDGPIFWRNPETYWSSGYEYLPRGNRVHLPNDPVMIWILRSPDGSEGYIFPFRSMVKFCRDLNGVPANCDAHLLGAYGVQWADLETLLDLYL